MEVLGNGSANGRLCKGQAVALTGCETDLNVTVLSVTAGLLLILTFNVNGLGNSLAVRDLGSVQLNGRSKAVLQLGNDNVKVKVAHTVDKHFLGLRIVFELNGKVLVKQTGNTLGNLILIALCVGNDCH